MPNDVKWIKLTTDMFDDEKIRLIEAMPDGDTILVLWTKLLCQAGKCNAGGYIYIAQDIPYTVDQLATLFNRKISTVKLAFSIFEKFHMIQLINGHIFLLNFEKHQNIEALQSIRESAKLRQQRHRLALKQGNDNVTVTNVSRDVTPLDIDIDKRDVTVTLENEIEKENKPPLAPPKRGSDKYSNSRIKPNLSALNEKDRKEYEERTGKKVNE